MRFRLLLLGPVAGALLLISTGSAAPPPIRIAVAPTEATSLSATSVTYNVKAYDTTVDPNVPITATCTGGSGSGDFLVTADFPLGNNSAECTATLGDGTPVSQAFTVAVVDTTAPSFGSAPAVTESTTDPAGRTVSYPTPTATDLGESLAVNCTPASGSQFVVGTTQVDCSANDGRGNTGHVLLNVTVTFNDTQPPTFTPNPPPPIDATTSGIGAVVNYTVTATDDSGTPTVTCTPPSGSTFQIGQTTVNCTASDGTNSATASFTVTVVFVDTTGPAFSGVPANLTVEANGPAGSTVNYSTPSAIDAVDGPIGVVPCTPASGTTFPIGTTAVNCSATDAQGNAGHVTFNVTVADTTGPNLIVPGARSIYATTPTGVPNTVSSVVSFLYAASASDIVDPSPVITTNAPDFLPVGNLTITFGARDWSGTATYKDVELIVLPQPPPGTPPLPIPSPPVAPAEVRNVKVTPLDGAVRIQWDAGGRKVIVTRSTSSTRSLSAVGDETVVYTGNASSYVDRGLRNGVEYRYVVAAVDAAGNQSAGVAAVVVPRRNLLRSPKDGVRLRKAPKLIWVRDPEAQYYNAQLLLNGVKVLSTWPTRPSYLLKKSWRFKGRKYTLKPGVYRWYVWPGYGARSAVDYGELMGSRTFRMIR
jgi:hypothetical protein